MTAREFQRLGSGMGWILRLVETGVEGPLGSVDVLEIDRPGNLDDLADLGLRLAPEPGSTGGGRKPNAGIMPPNGRHAGPAVPHAGAKIIVPTGLPPCSACSRFDCPASAVPAVGPIRLGLSGRRSAARPPSSTRSGRSFPPSCPTVLQPACSNSCSRLRPVPKPCAPRRSRLARTCAMPHRLNLHRPPQRSP